MRLISKERLEYKPNTLWKTPQELNNECQLKGLAYVLSIYWRLSFSFDAF